MAWGGCAGLAAAWRGARPLGVKINWPLVGDSVLSMVKALNVLIARLEANLWGLCVADVIVSGKEIG